MVNLDGWHYWANSLKKNVFKSKEILKHVYYLGWNRSPAQVGCMRQMLRPGALGRPRGIGWSGWWEGWSGWGIHVYPWLIHVNVWQKPLQYCKVISLHLIKKKKQRNSKVNHCSYSKITLKLGLLNAMALLERHLHHISWDIYIQLIQWIIMQSKSFTKLSNKSILQYR